MQFLRQSLQWCVRTVQSYPLATSAGLISASGAVAYAFCSMTLTQPHHTITNETMTRDEARLRAMVQMAQSSTTDERLDVIRYAQERFMLPPDHPGRSAPRNDYEAKVEALTEQILQEDQQKRDAMARDPNKMWKD